MFRRTRPPGLAGHEGDRGRCVDCGRCRTEAADGDIFVHAAVLRRHGMESLAPGQKGMVRIAEGQKGLQVVEIRAA